MRRILSAMLSLVVLITAVYVPLALTAYATDTSFETQHMEVDFSNYNLAAGINTYQIKTTPTYAYNYQPCTIETDGATGNKYMRVKKKEGSYSSFNYEIGFMLNPTGVASKSTVYQLVQGATYRITFKHKGTAGARALIYCAGHDTYKTQWSNLQEVGSQVVIPAADDWTTLTFDFTVPNHDYCYAKSMYLAILSHSNYLTDTTFDVCVDDIVVDRLGSVIFNNSDNSKVELYGVPASTRNDGVYSPTLGENVSFPKTDAKWYRDSSCNDEVDIANTIYEAKTGVNYYSGTPSTEVLAFKTQHMEVDFSNYNLAVGINTYQIKTTPTYAYNYQPCTIETDSATGNKYMRVKKKEGSYSSFNYEIGFMLNPTGVASKSTVYQLVQGATYRITFKHKGTTGARALIYCAGHDTYKTQWSNLQEVGSQVVIPAADDWTTLTFDFTVPSHDYCYAKSMYLAILSHSNYLTDTTFDVCIDDVVVDRLGSVTLHNLDGSENVVWGAPEATVSNKMNSDVYTLYGGEAINFPDIAPAQWYTESAGENSASGAIFKASFDRHFYAVASQQGPWDGLVAENYAGGDGSKGNPYQIATANQLAKLARSASANNHYTKPEDFTGGKYYVLTADIELNDTTEVNWYENRNLQEWKYYVTSTDNAFCGYLNGQGHTVKGLYINQEISANTYAGLFGALGKGAVIENLKIAKSYIKSKNAAAICGGLCNNIANTDVQPIVRRCHIDYSVIIKGENAAGIMAFSGKPITTESCYIGADIDGTDKEGLFYACTWTGPFAVKDSYAINSDTAIPPFGHQAVTGINSYTTSVSKDGFIQFDPALALGENAKTQMPKLNYNGVWVTAEGITPRLKFFAVGYSATENDNLNNPVTPEPEKDYYGPWDGTCASAFAGGNGTKDDPYRISTPEQLALLVDQTLKSYWKNYSTFDKYYILTNDIVINDTTKADWKEHAREWITASVNPDGSDCHSKAFAGVLDGNGHVIKGLYTNNDETDTGAGLFVSITQNAVIKNIGIEDSYLKANLVGAFAMRDNNIETANTSFIACYVDESVEIISSRTADSNTGWAGGLIGYSQRPLTIKYCYVKASISGYINNNIKQYGAFYGFMSNNSYITILGSYTACPEGVPMIGPRAGIGIFVASTYSSNNKDDNSAQILAGVPMYTVERMTGHDAALEANMANFNFTEIWYTVENDTPKLRVFLDDFAGPDPETVKDISELTVYDDAKPEDVWRPGTIASEFAGGTGTEQDPYQIATAEQLAFFLRDVIEKSAWGNYRSTDKHYKITADIYLNDVSDPNWRKNNPAQWFISSATQGQCFAGHLDGGGHIVYGLYIDSEDKQYASLFGAIGGNAVVENLGLADSYIYGGDKFAGGLFSYVENRAWTTYKEPIIRNCFIAEDVYLSGGCAGGIVAANATTITIENSYSLATVEGTATRYGGIIGYQWYNGIYKDQDNASQIAKTNIINCYVSEAKKIPVIGTLTYLDWVDGKNVYGLNSQTANISSVVSFGNMCGDKAKEYFKGFDFVNTWETLEKSTPILKVFKNVPHKYDVHFCRTKGPVTVSFETYGGTEIASLVGETGEKLVLPTNVTRGIDVFDGWYVYDLKTWDIPFNFNYFPDDDITLYAKWIVKGSDQDFENYPYTDAGFDGMGDDYELFRLGVLDYKMDFVHGGAKSLHRIGNSSEIQIASLADGETVKLVKGGEYEFTAWIYVRTKGENVENTDLMLAYLPDYDWVYGVTNLETICNTAKLTVGQWQQIKYTFVATEEYIGIATPGNTDMFIDDVTVTPTGRQGLENNKLLSLYSEQIVEETITLEVPIENSTDSKDETTSKNKTTKKKVIIKRRKINTFGLEEILIISGVAVLVIAATTALIIFLKKRKKKKV